MDHTLTHPQRQPRRRSKACALREVGEDIESADGEAAAAVCGRRFPSLRLVNGREGGAFDLVIGFTEQCIERARDCGQIRARVDGMIRA